YSGVTLAYAAPLVGLEPWEFLIRAGYTKATGGGLFIEHAQLDAFIERLAIEPDQAGRVRIMRGERGPGLHEDIPAVAFGAVHTIVGVGSQVGEWPLIPGHMGFHNWEYVTHRR